MMVFAQDDFGLCCSYTESMSFLFYGRGDGMSLISCGFCSATLSFLKDLGYSGLFRCPFGFSEDR